MRVLFLHSGTELTGSYTYAKALEKAWGPAFRVFYINDAMAGAERPALALPMRRKLFPHGFLNAARVAGFVRENDIAILHSHSRRANVVAALASRISGAPYVTTAHLSQRPQLFNRLWPCFGDQTIAICENIQDNLFYAHRLSPDRVSLVRNGIDLSGFRPAAAPEPDQRWISVVGRLSGRRWRAAVFILELLPALLKKFDDVRVRFLGSVEPIHQAEWSLRLKQLNAAFAEPRVIAGGFAGDVRPLLSASAVVIAAGRSLLEAMAMERPVVAVGEQDAPGLLTPENFNAAQCSNFGDFRKRSDGSAIYDSDQISRDLAAILNRTVDLAALTRWGRDQVERHYNIERVAVQVEKIYQQARQ